MRRNIAIAQLAERDEELQASLQAAELIRCQLAIATDEMADKEAQQERECNQAAHAQEQLQAQLAEKAMQMRALGTAATRLAASVGAEVEGAVHGSGGGGSRRVPTAAATPAAGLSEGRVKGASKLMGGQPAVKAFTKEVAAKVRPES